MTPQIDKSITKTMCDQEEKNNNYLDNNSTSIKSASTKKSWTINDYNLLLTRLWRQYGVKLSYVFTFYLFWYNVTSVCIDRNPNSKSENFTFLQTLWLVLFRVTTLFFVNFTVPGLVSLFLYTMPACYDDDDEKSISMIKKHDPIRLIIRIVTRGDYPKLIKDNLAYHENLFKSYWRQDDDEIEIHLVSEMPLNLSRPKRNGTMHRCEVKEFDIPTSYRTPNNTLYKARNNTFALERCLEEAKIRQDSLDRIWTISIDEDVYLTRHWLKEFDETVLNSKADFEYKVVNSPSRPIFLDENNGMNLESISLKRFFSFDFFAVPFFGETFRFAMDVARVWWEAKLFGRSAVGIRGSCYGIRLDVESEIGYDCGGPFLSIGDDTTFFHRLMMKSDVKLKFLDAWFLEGAPITAITFMRQRARWVRNYLYFLLFSQVPILAKFRLASFLFSWTVVLPTGCIVWLIGLLGILTNGGFPFDFFPAGPAMPIVDALSCVSGTCIMYWYIYGCALLLPWYGAVFVFLTMSTYIPMWPLHAIGSIAAVWGLLGAVYELKNGAAEFGMTEKKMN